MSAARMHATSVPPGAGTSGGRAAVQAGVRVEALAGPSALLAGLVVSGLPTDQFHFGGFLPSKHGQRTRVLESLRDEAATLIFYEAPHRILESLEDIGATLGEREVVVARELTKIYPSGETEIRALDGVDLDLFEGELIVLLGASGIIVGWDRDDWEIRTTAIGLDIVIGVSNPDGVGKAE